MEMIRTAPRSWKISTTHGKDVSAPNSKPTAMKEGARGKIEAISFLTFSHLHLAPPPRGLVHIDLKIDTILSTYSLISPLKDNGSNPFLTSEKSETHLKTNTLGSNSSKDRARSFLTSIPDYKK